MEAKSKELINPLEGNPDYVITRKIMTVFAWLTTYIQNGRQFKIEEIENISCNDDNPESLERCSRKELRYIFNEMLSYLRCTQITYPDGNVFYKFTVFSDNGIKAETHHQKLHRLELNFLEIYRYLNPEKQILNGKSINRIMKLYFQPSEPNSLTA